MIYFVQSGELVKIGYSSNISVRISQLKTDNNDIVVLGVMNGGRREEIYLHYIFRELRQRGEWFKIRQSILDYVRLNTRPYRDVNSKIQKKKVNQLIIVRGKEGLTQADLASRLGVSQQSIDKMEAMFEKGNLKLDRLQIYLNTVGYEIQFVKKAS